VNRHQAYIPAGTYRIMRSPTSIHAGMDVPGWMCRVLLDIFYVPHKHGYPPVLISRCGKTWCQGEVVVQQQHHKRQFSMHAEQLSVMHSNFHCTLASSILPPHMNWVLALSFLWPHPTVWHPVPGPSLSYRSPPIVTIYTHHYIIL